MLNEGIAGSEPQPKDDLRASLNAAWDDDEKTQTEPPGSIADTPAASPSDTPAERAERARDEQGRFARAEEKAAAAQVAQDATNAPPLDPAQAQAPVIAGPPPGWSVAAKAAFDKADPAIRDAVARRETEINQGFQKLTEYKGLDPYVEQARTNGSTLPEVLDRYIAAENLLADNFDSGIAGLCQMYQVHPAQLAQRLWEQFGQGNQNAQAQQNDPLAPVYNELSALKQSLHGFQQQREASEQEIINDHIAAFASDPKHTYFENVRADMGAILDRNPNLTLDEAYESACWSHPEIRALFIKEQTDAKLGEQRRVADQNRRASGSLPIGGPAGRPNGLSPNSSLRETLNEAWSASNL